MAESTRIVGLDVGGTQVKGGWIDRSELPVPDVSVLAQRTEAIDTDLSRGVDHFVDQLADFARQLGYDGAVGVGVPGVFHTETGELQRSANMKEIQGVRLVEELALRLGEGTIVVDNDANAAAFGEQWLGAGKGERDLILITLGTGVGGGIVLDDRIFRGPTGRGGEIGHLIVRTRDADEIEVDGVRCGCGAYGCLERLASATAAERRAAKAGLEPHLPTLSAAARAGDPAACEVFRGVGRDLGAGILSASALLDVTTVLIGGGFSRALDVLQPGIREALGERDYGGDPIVVREAGLGADAGWIGAARCAL